MTENQSFEVILTVFKDTNHTEVLGQAYIEQDVRISEIVQMIIDQFGEIKDWVLTVKHSPDA